MRRGLFLAGPEQKVPSRESSVPTSHKLRACSQHAPEASERTLHRRKLQREVSSTSCPATPSPAVLGSSPPLEPVPAPRHPSLLSAPAGGCRGRHNRGQGGRGAVCPSLHPEGAARGPGGGGAGAARGSGETPPSPSPLPFPPLPSPPRAPKQP